MNNPLLEDLIAEQTAELIASGNLKRGKAPPVFLSQWTHAGYVAHNARYTCSCGYSYDHIIGAFSRETAPTGETRDQILSRGFQIPLGHAFPVETSYHKVQLCPACVSSKGFQPLEE